MSNEEKIIDENTEEEITEEQLEDPIHEEPEEYGGLVCCAISKDYKTLYPLSIPPFIWKRITRLMRSNLKDIKRSEASYELSEESIEPSGTEV